MNALHALLFLLTSIIALYCKEIDFSVSQLFFSQGIFTYQKHPLFMAVYLLGSYPAYVSAFLCLFIYFFSFLSPSLVKVKKPIIFLLLVLAIGPGLLVNALFKEYWGRPRPAQTQEFGGSFEYQAFYRLNTTYIGAAKSFPSGHASMGFYFMSYIFVGKRVGNRQLTRWGYYLLFSLAPLLSLTRIAQGGHYFSDIWMSGIMVYITCFLLDKLIYSSSSGSKSLRAW